MLRFSFADSRAVPLRFRGMRIRPNQVVALVLLLNTIIVFRPFLFTGATLLSTTDSLFAHYPNILIGWRAIWAGGLPLWNPYEFAGMDFTASMHDHMLNPWYWPLLLLPESAVLPGLTAMFAACHLATGGFAYAIGRAFRLDWRTALLFAVSVQISGYWWFTTVTMISVFMGTGAIAAIYLLVTRHQRTALASFVGLYLAGSAITFGGHIAYIVAFGLPLVITVVLYAFADVRTRSPVKPLVAAVFALTLALATGGFRVYSVLDFLANISSFSLEASLGFQTFPADRAYFLLTSFIPNSFGFSLSESRTFLSILSVPGHHFHFAFYYGVPAAFLLTGAVCGHFRMRARVFALLAISLWMASPIAGFQPLTDLWSLTLIPVGHEISFRVLSAYFSFGGILFALVAIERSPRLAQRTVVPFLIIATLVVALLISFYIKNAYFAQAATLGLTLLARVAIGLLFVLTTFVALGFTRTRRNADDGAKAWWMLAGVTVAGWLGFLSVANAQGIPKTTTFFVSIDAATVLVVALLAILLPFLIRDERAFRWTEPGQTWPLRIAAVTAVCLVGLVCFFPLGMEIPARLPLQIAVSGLSNGLRTLVVAAATVWLFTWWIRKRRSSGTPTLVVALIVLTFIDLHGFLRTFEYSGGPPFQADVFPKAKFADAVLLADRQQAAGDPDIWRMIDSDPAFAATPVPPPWRKGGMASSVDYVPGANAGGALRLANEADDYATLFYDLPASDQDRWVAIGAWFLAEPDVKTGMFISNSLARTAPRVDSTGTGRWIWTTTRILAPAGSTTRFHVFVQGRGSILIQSLRLVPGWNAPPVVGAERPGTAYVDRGALPTAKDLRNYRVNFPYLATGHWSGSALSSIASVYGLMEYGGADSALPARLLWLMDRVGQFGSGLEKSISSTATNNRLLDLLAVGFDAVGPTEFVRRPNAVSRFSLLDHFEVEANDFLALDRLASDAFDPTRSVILADSPGWATPSSAEARRFEPLVYDGGRFDRLDFDLDNARPRIFLFDDSYSQHWRATWNGKPIPILRANFNFMALGIPAGQGHLVLEFRPQPFLTLAYLSWAIFLIVLGCGIVLLVRALAARALRTNHAARDRELQRKPPAEVGRLKI